MYDIFFDLDKMYQMVEINEEENSDDSECQISFNFDCVDTEKENKITGPQTCKLCQDSFPYAEPNEKDGSFKCYSCRNWE